MKPLLDRLVESPYTVCNVLDSAAVLCNHFPVFHAGAFRHFIHRIRFPVFVGADKRSEEIPPLFSVRCLRGARPWHPLLELLRKESAA